VRLDLPSQTVHSPTGTRRTCSSVTSESKSRVRFGIRIDARFLEDEIPAGSAGGKNLLHFPFLRSGELQALDYKVALK
jgi:hypothetical protein